MQVILNEQGFVEGYALVGGFETPSAVVDEPENFDDFKMNYRSYYLSESNVLVKNNDRQRELEDQKVLDNLRSKREKKCFPIINRGALWYEKLSEEQKAELDAWYRAWLNVTETKIIPEMPEWLK